MKSKYLMIGAAFFSALFLFSGVMLWRQYADEKQSAEAFDKIAALVEAPKRRPPTSRRNLNLRSLNKPLLKSTLWCMNRTAILWAGFR